MTTKILTTTLTLLCSVAVWAQPRQEITLSDNWQFSLQGKAANPSTHNQSWQTVSVPHDWAISGPFDKKWDLQKVAIEQNGEKEATEKSGRSGALPWIGEGHYKRTFTIPQGFDGHAELVFDGAMAEPTVSVNGKVAGYWAYGYNAFRIDITDYIKPGENLLEVSLKNLEESSRWYPGAGIYRPVKLVLTPKIHIDDWSIYARTIDVNMQKNVANVTVDVNVENAKDADPNMRMILSLADAGGRVVAARSVVSFSNGFVSRTLPVPSPQLWSPESPYIYTLTVSILKDGKDVDKKSIKTGIRTVRVSKEKGFQLNGVTRKLKGVCLHHDLGPLGAAVNKAAIIRQIKILKEMGCDAIRTAHNMPSQMQMDICDSLGMMVMAESFDMWQYPKCKNGYARFFDEWAEKDISNLVKANRNHPSIVMWSIGNEIPEHNSEIGRQISIRLQGLCHALDPTRPVTQGMDRAEQALKSGIAQAMDVPGFNYRVHKYQTNIEQLPQGFLLGSETASTVSSRGIYKFPVEVTDNSRYASWAPGYDPNAIKTADGQCSSYDVEYCSWSNLPDDDWVWQDDYPWVIGEFVWTGFDYLGEPTPYDEYWPSRSSYFGICDLAGLPKDRYYLYRSKWRSAEGRSQGENKDEHTIHLLPHWTWPGRKGQVTPVYCYTDYPEAELFVNGKSQGRIKKNPKERLDRYRLRWNNVKYEPGELKVIIFDEMGKNCGEKTVHTAGKPAQLKLDVWTQSEGLIADGEDLAFVTVSLVDKNGTLIPDAADQLLEPFTKPTMKLFNGQLVVVVQAAKTPGDLTLTVNDAKRKFTKTINIPVK